MGSDGFPRLVIEFGSVSGRQEVTELFGMVFPLTGAREAIMEVERTCDR